MIENIKQVQTLTGASAQIIKAYWKRFPKATVEDMINILRYDLLAVYHKISVDKFFEHLK